MGSDTTGSIIADVDLLVRERWPTHPELDDILGEARAAALECASSGVDIPGQLQAALARAKAYCRKVRELPDQYQEGRGTPVRPRPSKAMGMRFELRMPEELLVRIDLVAGKRGRARFLREAIEHELESRYNAVGFER